MPMIIGKDKSAPKMIAALLHKSMSMPQEDESMDYQSAGVAAATDLINAIQQGNPQKAFEMLKALYDICDSMEDASEESMDMD